MLFEHLDRLCSDDVLLLDRGYPCRWLVAALSQRNISFCMRVEKSGNAGFACVSEFLRSGLAVEQDVAAKVLCDNLQALATLEARGNDELPDRERINRA